MGDFKRGISAALSGLRLSFGNADVRRSYAKVVAFLFLITALLDGLGIWGLWSLADWDTESAWWVVTLLVIARVVGTLGVVVAAPVIAIFTMNIVMPLFNEGPFLAGMQAINPERAAQLSEGENLSIPHQMKISALRLLLFVSLSLVAFVVSFIPVVGQIAGPLLGLYFTSRALGWELLDPYFAFTNTPYDDQVKFLGEHHTAVVGFGLPFALMFAIPLVGPLLFVLAQAAAASLVTEVLEAPADVPAPSP
jgi:uncharacterized protein involved in cysteine biosynthesis